MFKWQNWNDQVSLLLLIGIPGLWIVNGLFKLAIHEQIMGASIAMWTLVIQYYFRRSPP